MGWGKRGSEWRPDRLDLLARALGAAPDERRASIVVRQHVARACRADSVILIACGPERGRAEIRDDSSAPTALAVAATRGTACLTVRLGRPHAARSGDGPLLACELCGALEGDTACAPLTAAGVVIGSVLATGRALAEDAPETLDAVAAVAGPAIAALRAFDLATVHAHSDPLTGLPNRRAAEDRADQMTAFAVRSAQPLSLMRIDVDGTAQINDRLGKETGDGILRSLAAALRTRLRMSDLVARLGGDEFIVLLPDTEAEHAFDLGEALCRLARELTPAGATDPITVSVGIASFPADGDTSRDLFLAAERALLGAKGAGGDCVSTCTPPDPWSLYAD